MATASSMQIVASQAMTDNELHAQLCHVDLDTDFAAGYNCLKCGKEYRSASGFKKHLLGIHCADKRAVEDSDLHTLVRQADYKGREAKRLRIRHAGKTLGEGEAEHLCKMSDIAYTHVFCKKCKCSVKKNSVERHFTETAAHSLDREVDSSS